MPASSITLAASVYAVGINVGSNTLVIRADAYRTEGFTWLNNKLISVGDYLQLGTGLTCMQTSTRQYKCTVQSDFNLIVDMYEGHLAVQVWLNNCVNARGLFGPCGDDCPTNDFFSSSGSALDPTTELNITNIYNIFALSWKASTYDTMFSGVLPTAIPSSAEMCLRSSSGHAISEPVYSFTKAEVSVEIKFFLEAVNSDCATLWSYKNDVTFSLLICDAYVNIYFNNVKTKIKALNRIRTHTWYHLSIIWNDDVLELNFYLVYYVAGSLTYELASAAFGQSPLIPGGMFMIGQMYYDSSMDLEVMGWSFDGYFDEFTIWKKQVDLEFVIRNAFSYKYGTEDGLANLWRFNEGHGTVSLDNSHLQLRMEWVNGPRAHPEWAICGYEMEYPVLSHHIQSSVLSTHSNTKSESRCENLLEKTGLRNRMSDAAWMKFRQQCLFTAYALGDKSKVIGVILAISDAFMVNDVDKVSDMRSKFNWPGRSLCSDFKNQYLHGWTGDNCDVYCLSGIYNNITGECVCAPGFWNTSCNQICPFARNSPCGGGTCNKGVCTCTLDRYNSSTGCKECSAGWTGEDCSSVSADMSSAVKRMGISFSLGHTIMFDGQGYDIHTPGQYILIETPDVGLYIRMKPRGLYVVIQQLWISVSNEQFTIQTPLLDNDQLIFWHNFTQVDLVDSYTVTGSVIVSWEDQTSLKVDLSSFDNLILRITYLGSYLDVQVIFQASSCPAGVTGLLGNCDNNLDNDFYSSNSDTVVYSDVTQNIIDTSFIVMFVKTDTSGFVFTYPGLSINEPVNMQSGYCLFFNQWGIMSAPLSIAVFDGTKNTTFDIKIKVLSDNGLILGYSLDSKFSIFVELLQLKLWANGQKYNANYTLAKDQWYHFFVSHNMASDTVMVTLFIDRLLTHQFTLKIPDVAFQSGGYLILGFWQVQPPTDFGKLVGMFGTLRLWDKVLDDYMMFDASITRVVTGYENLILLFDFTEGVGLTAMDSVNGVGMGLPRTGEVTWFITDLPQVDVASVEFHTANEAKEVSINSNRDSCTDMLQSASLQSSCAALGSDFVSSYFHDACLTDDSYISSLNTYVDVCTTVLVPPTSPVIDICTNWTDPRYQTVCSEFCKFGKPLLSGCSCNDGYWGKTCDGVCPGGSSNPCYGNGICDVRTGLCGCFQGFSYQHNCSVCQDMYMEPTCELRYPPTFNTTDHTLDITKEPVIKYCSISSVGLVIDFKEVSFDFKQVGQYYLVKPDNNNANIPDIQITTTSCYLRRACITAVYFKYKADSIFVQGAASSGGDITVILNSLVQYSSTVQTGLQDLKVDNSKETNYWLKSVDNELRVLVSHSSTDARYLYVSIYMNDTRNCMEQDSICGSCTIFTLGTNLTVYNESWKVLDSGSNPGTNETSDSRNNTSGSVSYGMSGDGWRSGSHITEGTGGFAIDFFQSRSDGSVADYEAHKFKSVVSTDILKGVITNENGLTISFKTYPKQQTGTILTYSHETVFDVFLENEILKFAVGNDINTSGISVATDQWHHVSLVWSDITQQMLVYVTSLETPLKTENYIFTVPKVAFNDFGILTVGSFNPPFDPSVQNPINKTFIGLVDELFVLDTALEASEESQFRNDPVPLNNENLKLYYNFDTVDNYVVPDLINSNDLTVHTLSWKKPAVTFPPSDCPITPYPTDDEPIVSVSTVDYLDTAIERCSKYFNNTKLVALCANSISSKMYWDNCITLVEATGDTLKALETALQYAEACNFMLSLTSISTSNSAGGSGNNTVGSTKSTGRGNSAGGSDSRTGNSTSGSTNSIGGTNSTERGGGGIDDPLKLLCGEDPVATGYVGANCNIPCKFPDPNGDGLLCNCATGYFGTECDQICPGGSENPCFGNGICNQNTGTCNCSSNFQGRNCNECASGWTGGECQLIIQKKVPRSVSNFFSCSLTSDRHLGVFDGTYLSLETKEDGTFIMYLDSHLKIDIQLGPCSTYSKCVLAIGFAAGGNIASVVPQNTGVVKLNGEEIIIDNSITLSSRYTLQNPSTGNFYLQGPNQFSIDVSVQPSFLNVFISSKTCPDASGFVGICSGCGQQSSSSCASDDMLCLLNTLGIVNTILVNDTLQTFVITDYFQQFKIDYDDSVFGAANESKITAGYAVNLETQNSFISFPPFGVDVFSSMNGSSKSLEIRCTIVSSNGGTVFSYATKDKTFGIVVENGKFVLQYGPDKYPTGIHVVLNEWSNLGLSYDESTGEVLFDYIYSNLSIHSYAIINNIGPGALDVDGTLTIGQWNGITTNVLSVPPPGSCRMVVDRVLVWDKKLSPKNYIDNYVVNIISREEGLTSIYNFEEGTGYATKDSLTDNVASIDIDSIWTQSDVYIVPESSQVDDESTLVVQDETAENICGDLKDELAQECSDLTSVLDNMYKACFDDVAKTGNPDNSIDSALLASKICSKELLIKESLQGACNDFPSRSFPDWVGDLCDTHCYHGTFSTDLGCECAEGYYEDTCSDVCPGGPVPPCSGHGTCLSDGTCKCEPNWNGDSKCSSCAKDYSQPNCDELQVKPDSSCTRTKCSMNKDGMITRMDCTKKKYDETGTMVLLEYGTLKITVRNLGQAMRFWYLFHMHIVIL